MHQSAPYSCARSSRATGGASNQVWPRDPFRYLGTLAVETLGGKKYYISYTDDAFRWSTVFLLRLKSEAFETYQTFFAWVKTQLGVTIECLHSDRGGEYMDTEFVNFLEQNGTNWKLTVHDTPEENGVSERLNRTLMEKVRALLVASGLPLFLWGEALFHAVWLKNRTSTKALGGKTPFEALHKEVPDLQDLPEWGCNVWVHDRKTGKIATRAKAARWVGYDAHSNGHRIYWPEKRSVTVERNVRFSTVGLPVVVVDDVELEGEGETTVVDPDPDMPAMVKPDKPESPPPELIVPNLPAPPADALLAPAPEPQIPPKRPSRARKPSRYVRDVLEGRGSADNRASKPALPAGVQAPTAIIEADDPADEQGELGEVISAIAMAVVMADARSLEPRNVPEAMRSPAWPKWKEAMEEEHTALAAHRTWKLEKPPPGANIVGCRWVFRLKQDASGAIVRYRARLVAQGYSQVPGVDFFDTYAPVANLASIRVVLALAARNDFEIHQIDIKSAYLNGEFEKNEVIYMKLPPGLDLTQDRSLVLRLLRPLYGLRQSGRHWYRKLWQILRDALRMRRCEVDQAVFYRVEGAAVIVIVAHVDDLTIVTSSSALMGEVKSKLSKSLKITDLGEIHWILGISVHRDRPHRTLALGQEAYVEAILQRFGFGQIRPLSMPMDPNVTLTTAQSPQTPEEAAEMEKIPYREAVGSLMYAALGTRPDIAYAVGIVSKFNQSPGQAHWTAVKRIFAYLGGTRDLKLMYGDKGHELVGYSDADGSMHEERRAISGYAFLIDGGAVSWSSKKQEVVALSTTEAEYVALTHATKEAMWLRTFVGGILGRPATPTTLHGDNQSAIALTKDHQYHARTKHIDIRFHFIRWVIQEGHMKLVYCPTDDMIADTLTKALPSPKVKHFARELGLRKN